MIQENDDPTVTADPRMFPALSLLENKFPPLRYGHPPYWRAPVTEASERAFIPSWNWSAPHHEIPKGDRAITCDFNGAFLAAIGSVNLAFSQLKRVGHDIDAWGLDPRKLPPGYYLIDNFHWGLDSSIVSPLGNDPLLQKRTRLWIPQPTMVLLLELLFEGTLTELIISDAMVSQQECYFRGPSKAPEQGWIYHLKKARNLLLDNIGKAETEDEITAARARYDAFKEGYGSALSMMVTGQRCKTRRPDWTHAVKAQHAATMWRKMWRFSLIGPVLAMDTTDEVTVLESDLQRALAKPSPPVRWDPSGRNLNYLKEKPRERPAAPTDTTPEDLVYGDDFEDVL